MGKTMLIIALLLTACSPANPFTDVEPGVIGMTEIDQVSYADSEPRLFTASSIAEQEDFPEALRGPRDVAQQVLMVWCDSNDFTLADRYSNGTTLFLTVLRSPGEGRCRLWASPRAQLQGVTGVIVQDIDEQTLEVGYLFP